jgi:S1-C subfamily serine protease
VTVATISDELRTRYELPEAVKGVVIVEVKEGGPAGAESLRPGDVIVEVGQEEVASPPDVAAKINQAQQDNKKSVLLLVDRQGDLRFVALRFPDAGGGSPEGGAGVPEAPGGPSEGGRSSPDEGGAPPEGGGGSE